MSPFGNQTSHLRVVQTSTRMATILALLALGASACGPGPYKPLAPKGSTNPSLSAFKLAPETQTVGTFSCGSATNVNPDYDFNLNGTDFFKACPHMVDPSQVMIAGMTNQDDRICAFPTQYVDKDQVVVRPDALGTGPAYACTPYATAMTQQSWSLKFPGVSFNALFIVEGRFKDQMWNCLKTGNYYGCPHYSFGKFR